MRLGLVVISSVHSTYLIFFLSLDPLQYPLGLLPLPLLALSVARIVVGLWSRLLLAALGRLLDLRHLWVRNVPQSAINHSYPFFRKRHCY